VLGSSIASKLFPEETGSDITLTGRTLRINRIPFTVIGVLAPKGYGINGYNQDDVILMPITTARSRLWESAFANTIVTMIIIKADAGVNLDYVGQDVLELLQQHHKMPDTTSFQSTA
jgi:putative ABC transport system permease protein